jgi:hypothetical protein
VVLGKARMSSTQPLREFRQQVAQQKRSMRP